MNELAKPEKIEQKEHRGRIIADLRNLMEKYRSIFDWDGGDINRYLANKLILVEIRKALDVIEMELSERETR